jgi:excisionase family DNA binding protein
VSAELGGEGRRSGLEIPEEWIEELAARVLDRLDATARRLMLERHQRATLSEFLTVKSAARLMDAPEHRVRALLSQRKLRTYKDGARTLVRRDELLAYIEASASPERVAGALPPSSRSRIGRGRAA